MIQLYVVGYFLAGEKSEDCRGHRLHVNLPSSRRQHVHDLLVRNGDDTVVIDFNDSVTNTDTSTLSNTSTEKGTNL